MVWERKSLCNRKEVFEPNRTAGKQICMHLKGVVLIFFKTKFNLLKNIFWSDWSTSKMEKKSNNVESESPDEGQCFIMNGSLVFP